MKSFSVSTFLRFMIGFAVILFVGTLAFHPDLMEWLRIHPAWDAVAVLAGTIFHWWNTYHRPELVHGR
jgi:hypothetical protein